MAAFLEERSRAPDARHVNHKLVELIAARPGEFLLEAGSGSGILCRMLAGQLQPGGIIVGVDISPDMLVEARCFAREEGLLEGFVFQAGAAEALPYPHDCFDGAIAARTLLHVDEPARVLQEMIRVVKPGGRIVVMDWDFETVAVDHPERELTRRLLHWRSDHHGGNNWSGRQLWRLLKNAGLSDVSVHPWVSVAQGEADGLTQSLWRAAQVACEAGAISPQEQQAWIAVLKDRIKEGAYFASIVYFMVKGIVNSNGGTR